MKNVLDFFQKNKKDQEKKGKSRPFISPGNKNKSPSEARFSVDQRGREIYNLFTGYLSASADQDPTNNLFLKQQFISFADDFVGTYETIIDHQKEEPLYCEDDREPRSIEDTWGHPTQLVVHIARLLYDYLPITPQSKDSSNPSSELLEFSLKWVFDEIPQSGLDPYERQIFRNHLLRVLYTLSILCFWPHNRNILLEQMGKTFVRVLILITRIFIAKVEEIIIEIIELGKQHETGITPPSFVTQGEKLNEDANFILHALMASVHVLARGSPGLVRCLGVYNTFHFPRQPWNTQQRMQLGYSHLAPSPTFETRPKNDAPNIPLSTSYESSSSDELSLPEELFLQYEGSFDNPEEEYNDGWSFTLIQCGTLRALISLISKLIYLNKALSSSSLYLLTSLTGKDNHQPQRRSSFSSRSIVVTWQSSVALQCEALVAILSFTVSHPISTHSRLHISDGFSIMNTLLSMQDCPAIESITRPDFYLGMHRSFLCLRLTEIILAWGVKDPKSSDSTLQDALQSFDNLQLFFSWIQSYLTHSKLNSANGDPTSSRNVLLKVSNTSCIHTSQPRSDLWPWSDQQDTPTGHFDDAVKTNVEVDLCDWGAVMLGYAGTESLLLKYVRSMKQSGTYSLRTAFIDVFEGLQGTHQYLLPWFVTGLATEIWDQVFAVLYALFKSSQVENVSSSAPYPPKQAHPGSRMETSQDLRNKYFTAILTEIFQSLSYCILAPTISIKESVEDNEIDTTANSSTIPCTQLPILQMHMIHFIGACIDFNPEAAVNVARLTKIWMLISTSTCFLLGGQDEISELFHIGKRMVETHGSVSTMTWCLHSNHLKGYEYPKLNGHESSSFQSPKLRTQSGEKEGLLQEEDDLSAQLENLSDSDIRSNRPRRDTVESFQKENERELFGDINFELDDQSPSQLLSTQMNQAEATESLVPSDRPTPDCLFGDMDMETEPLAQVRDLSDATLLSSFAWLTLGDSIMQLMSLVVETQNRQTSSKFSPSVEVQVILQAITKETPDHIVTQSMCWLQNTLSRLNSMEDSDKYRQILFKCVSLCKYQLLTCCDPTRSIPANDSVVPFWIGEEIQSITQLRPLLWSSRHACLSVIQKIMLSVPGEHWIRAFLPKITPQLGSTDSFHPPSKSMITPKHATLLLLILDPKCRQLSLRLLIEILHICTCLTFNLPQNPMQKPSSNSSQGSKDASLKKQSSSSKADHESSKTIYQSLFHDIVKYLLVSHIKYALLQPRWCNGPDIVASVCQWIKSLFCDPQRASYLSSYQQMFLLYGPSTHYHQLLNWSKPRPNIFREILLSLDECLRNSPSVKQGLGQAVAREIQIQIMRHFLSLLTALMLDSPSAKAKFSSLMTLRKFSKQKAKVANSLAVEVSNQILNPTNPCNLHDVATMIISLEGSPSVETILILFDMLLDGPKQNNRSYMIQAQIASSVGMFFQENTKVCFSNLTVISLLLLLIPSCTEENQTFIFATLKNLLIGKLSLVNLSKCSHMDFPILDSLIDLFPVMPINTLPLCAKLMHVVGRHNVTVAQLKRIFRLMHVKGDYRPQYTSLLLECLRLMVNSSKMPKHFFLFEGGIGSGIKIPPIYRWPAPSGYSFCFWFSVQNDGTTSLSMSAEGSLGSCRIINSKSENYSEFRPTLLSFRQNSGIGLEVFLRVNRSVMNGYTLVFQTHRDITETTECSKVEISSFRDGQTERPIFGGDWNFLAFSHTPGKFRGRSELAILLNASITRHQFPFPRYLGEIEEPVIGNMTPTLTNPSISTAFRGQIGSFYFFVEPLSEQQMRKIYQLGMDASHEIDTTYINKRLLQSQLNDSSSIPTNLEPLSSSVLLAYYPGVGDGCHVLDMSPEKNSNRWGRETASRSRSFAGTLDPPDRGGSFFKFGRPGGKMHAMMLSGCHRCTFKDMRDALDCLGGKRVLIPLFAQFDLPTLNKADMTPIYSIDTKMCEEIGDLFFALSREEDDNAPQFELMAYFLERISPKYLTSQLLQIFLDNVYKFSSSLWSNGVVKHLLVHFKLWRLAPFETQQRLFVFLLRLCQLNPSLMRGSVSIRELFETLSLFYSFGTGDIHGESDISDATSDFSADFDDFSDQSPRLSAPNLSLNMQTSSSLPHSRPMIREHSNDAHEELNESQIEEIQSLIFQMIFSLMTATPENSSTSPPLVDVNSPTPEEVQCIVYYLAHAPSPVSKLRALCLLLSLLSIPSLQKRLLAGFEIGVKVYPILALHMHPQLKIRMYALLTFCNILQLVLLHGTLPGPAPERKELTTHPSRVMKTMNSPEQTLESLSLDDVVEVSSDGGSVSEVSDVGDEFLDTFPSHKEHHSPMHGSSLSPKNSFSFISPKNFSGKGFFRDPKSHQAASMDTFERVGVSVATLRYVLTWIESNFFGKEDAEVVRSEYDLHCKVIVKIMTLTMVGLSSLNLRFTIDRLFPESERIFECNPPFEDVANENLSESIFCLPAFLPAIIRFISRDVVSYSLRFSTLVGIKTKLQTFQNCDLFLQVPDWQISLFELLSMEQNRIEHLKQMTLSDESDSNRQKDINRSSGIIDTATRMLCELFVHCVEYGCPSPDNVVEQPNHENTRSHPKPTPLAMLQEISKGKRIFAPVVLKETIGYLKCYARRCELDVNNVAVSFLQQIINALTLRRESWKATEVKEEYQQYIRGRAFNVCCWLTCSFILEFVTSPCIESRGLNSEATPRKASKPPRRRSSSNLSTGSRNVVSSQDSSDASPTTQKPFALDVEYVHETYDPNASRGRSWSASHSEASSSFRSGIDASTSAYSSHVFEMGVVDKSSSQSLWFLLESIINLLDSLSDIQGNTQARIRIALTLGLKSSTDVLDVVNGTIDESLPSTTAPIGITETDLEKKLLAIPIRKISAMICWRIVRILCNIYCNNAASRVALTPAQQTLQLESIKNLDHIINTLEVKDWGSPRFEIILTVARIASVLKHTSHRPVDQWVQDSFRLLVSLLGKASDDIVARLYQVGFSFVAETTDPSASQLSLLPLVGSIGSNDGNDEIDVRKLTELDPDSRRGTADLVLHVINRSLRVGPDSTITWTVWDAAMAHVIADGVRMEDEVLSGTLTEFGLDKGSLFAAFQLETFHGEEQAQFSILSKRYQVVAKKASEHEVNSLKKHSLNSEAVKKRNLVRWNMILEDLANERGPWGVGAEEGVEVYWVIDSSEDHLRRRLKFRRNPFGSRHEVATQIAFGRVSADDTESVTSGVTTEVSEEKGSSQSSTNTQSLWKDLIKYQSRPNQRVDEESAIGNAESGEDLPEEALLASDEINRTLSSNAVESVDSQQTMALENSEKILFSASCEIITSATNSLCRPAYGILEVTSTKITFTKKGPAPQKKPAVVNFHSSQMENDQFLWAIRTFPSTQWSVEEIRNVLPRTFYLRQIAVELFLTSRRCVFVNLLHQHAAMQFIIAIRFLVKPPFIEPYYGLKPQHIVQKMLAPGTTSQLTLAWQNREISNFQYLMHLNTIAGRSFNDLGQYPVFPWVIADYVSSELRLRDPGTFRDLRWPVGAQRKEQREEIIARYEDLDMMYEMSLQEHNDAIPALPPFHFGSHYSTAGFVMWFLMRMEPYTSLHVQLQDGKFDKADRLFDSLAAAWNGCIHNPSDVKELVPEFFYCPEILENMNRLDLGRKMNGDRKVLGEIELPPWATDSFDFVRLHRKALESEYVSQHLHHWIDLIFGYKQRPPYMRNGGNKAAVESCNVFFHLTYAGAVDLEELLEKDKVLYGQYVNQIAEFGQTPAQLFSSPHPQRLSLDDADIAWPIASVVLGADTIMRGGVVPDKPKKVMCFKAYKMSARPIVFIGESGDRLVTVDSSRVIGNHLWQCLQPDVTPPYKIKIDTVALEVSQGLGSGSSLFSMMQSSNLSSTKEKRINVPFYNQMLASTSAISSETLEDEHLKADPISKKDFLKYERESRKVGKRISLPPPIPPQMPQLPEGMTLTMINESTEFGSPQSVGTTTPMSIRSSVRESPAKKSSPFVSPVSNRHRSVTNSSGSMPKRRGHIQTQDEHVSSQLFAIHPTHKILFSCGHWDNTFKATAFESGRLLQSVSAHKDVVTCISLTVEVGKSWLVTGSRDCTLMIWEVLPRDLPLGNGTPIRTLYGHDDSVTSVSVNLELDVVVSGSNDGTIILHTLREGSYVRTILVGSPNYRNLSSSSDPSPSASSSVLRSRIHWVCVTNEGYIVVYLNEEHLLHSYTINGRLLATKDIKERLYAFMPSEDGQVLITGGDNCLVVFRWVHSLELANDGPRRGLEAVLDGLMEDLDDPNNGPLSSTIRSLYFTKQERHLLVGTDSGEVRIFAQDSEYLRQRLERKLAEIGIL